VSKYLIHPFEYKSVASLSVTVRNKFDYTVSCKFYEGRIIVKSMAHKSLLLSLLTSAALGLTSCGGGGSSSSNPPPPVSGPPPAPPPVVISQSVDLPVGDENCFQGGTRTDTGPDTNGDGSLSSAEIENTTFTCNVTEANELENFTRIANFPICLQIEAQCDTNSLRQAEIVDVSPDGNILVYTDAAQRNLGFIDITTASAPLAAGTRELPGEPTSVAILNEFALVTVDRAEVNSGSLEIVNLNSRAVVRTIFIAGDPDSVAISPDGSSALIGVQNPNPNESELPPIPGFLLSVDTSAADPAEWTTTDISLTGLANINPDDPEPEFVDINAENMAVVSLQMNNHLVLVDLETNSVTEDFTAGFVNVEQIDATEGEIDVISQTENLVGIAREPDGVAWINNTSFATANEGESDGGSRGFSIFNTDGTIAFDAGNLLEYEAARIGHYPDNRSENRGNEPEGADVGIFGSDRFLFIGSERGDLVFVYDIADPAAPLAVQSLPTSASPEGIKAIPSRNLVVVAGEEDNRFEGVRSAVSIYAFDISAPDYPTLSAEDRADGTPIPWAALSGLSVDPSNDTVLYSVEDAAFDANRIFRIDISTSPARVTDEIQLRDDNNILATLAITGESQDPERFDGEDRDDLVNEDGTANLDLEGITALESGDFWVVAEGDGDVEHSSSDPIDAVNLLVRVNASGVIEAAIRLPANVEAIQVDNGFAGVAEMDGVLYVPFQSPWGLEANNRIGRYDIAADQWDFIFYTPDDLQITADAQSTNSSRAGLGAITVDESGNFWVLENDSLGGFDSTVKRIYSADLAGAAANSVVSKTLVRDLLAEGDLPLAGGFTPNDLEALTILPDGRAYLVNDNDNSRNNIGETRLFIVE